MCTVNIEERLKVFISSAQGAENDKEKEQNFIWLDFRKKVKEKLNQCPYIKAFTIEDRTSEMKSNDFMIYNVNTSDIVVLLIKNELRNGTLVEYTHAQKINKPLLVYFFSDHNATEDVSNLKKDLKKRDYCTYRQLKDFDGAEDIIANDVIQNVIVYYQQKHDMKFKSESFDIVELSAENITENNFFAPTKALLSYFESCYSNIYDYLGIQQTRKNNNKSQLHDIGDQLLEWLINGTPFRFENVKSDLIDVVSKIYPTTTWYSKRLECIDSVFDGDYKKALEIGQEALALAEKEATAEWIINNILIDLRNIELMCLWTDGEVVSFGTYQEKIDKSETVVYMPVLDRYLENAYEELINEEIKRQTAAVGTTFFGSNVNTIMTYVENYLFSAVLYGSYTHIVITRTFLAKILYRIGKLFNNGELLYNSMKMYLFSGEYKEFTRLTNCEWGKIYDIFTSRSDEIWHQVYNLEEFNKDNIIIAALNRIGMYLSDRAFCEAEKYIFSLVNQMSRSISDNYFDCLLKLHERLDKDSIIRVITIIIEKRQYSTAQRLTKLISCLDISSVSDKVLVGLCETLTQNIASIIGNYGDPQFIAALVDSRPDVFMSLESIPNNGLTGLQKYLYDINIGKDSWKEILLIELQSARSQIEHNIENVVHIEYANNPFYLISRLLQNKLTDDLIDVLSNSFFPLCIEILDSNATITVKDECAECLCDVLGYYKINNISIPNEIAQYIAKATLDDESRFSVSFRSYEGLWCRIVTLKLIVGALDKDILIEWCFSYSKKDAKDRRALVECLQTFLQYSLDVKCDVDSLLVSIVFQCCDDNDFYVREIACDCLWYMLESTFSDLVEKKIYEMVLDSAPVVRMGLLFNCKKNAAQYKNIANRVVINLMNDANYIVRKEAKSILEDSLINIQ